MELWPGHADRGTGDHCTVCRRLIPPERRRPKGSSSDIRNDCQFCHFGVPHVHDDELINA